MRSAKNPTTAAIAATVIAGPRRRNVRSSARVTSASGVARELLLVATVDLNGEVDAETDEDRESGDGHHGEGNPEIADHAKGPDHAERHHSERQQAPTDTEDQQQDAGHGQCRDPTEEGHVAAHPVVDLLHEERRTGGDGADIAKAGGANHGDDPVRRRALLVDGQVAPEPHDHQRVAAVGKDAAERGAHRTGGVVDEEVDERRVGERMRPDGGEPGRVGVGPAAERRRDSFTFLGRRRRAWSRARAPRARPGATGNCAAAKRKAVRGPSTAW